MQSFANSDYNMEQIKSLSEIYLAHFMPLKIKMN